MIVLAEVKYWNGSQWARLGNDKLKRWDGSKWTTLSVKRWDGSQWQQINNQRYTTVYEATWNRSYWGDNTRNLTGINRMRICQGRYDAPDTYWHGDMGIEKAMIGFDHNKIRNDLDGAKIEKIELYIENLHFWYWAGGIGFFGVHNNASEPAGFSETRYGVASARWYQRGGAKWITLPNYVAEDFKNGQAKGITLHKNSTDPLYYGYWAGVADGSKRPKLRITYVK